MARWVRAASILSLIIFAAATILSPLPVAAQQTASVGVGDTSLDLSGLTSPDAFVTVRSGSAVIGSLTADSTGQFSKSFPAQTSGINQLSIYARDTEDRISDTITLQVNLQEHFPTAVQVFLPTSLSLESPTLLEGQKLHLSGQTAPSSQVIVRIDNKIAGTTTAAADGTWKLVVETDNLAYGAHELFAKVTDTLGNQSYATSAYFFSITRPALPPPVPGVPLPAKPQPPTSQLSAPRIISPSQNQIFHESSIIISGKGPARSQIELWDERRVIGAVWTTQNGSFELPLSFETGPHTLKARACLDNFCSDFSPAVTFSYQSQELSEQHLQATLNNHTFTILEGEAVTLELKLRYGTTPYKITVDWGDGNEQSVSLDKNSTVLEHIYDRAGKYNANLTVQDVRNSQKVYFAVNVQQHPDEPSTNVSITLLLAFLLALVLPLAVYYLQAHRQKNRSNSK